MGSALGWVRARDPGLLALRRAGRGAIVMPALFALGDKGLSNPGLATFAAFGSFALLLLVDFQGPMRERLLSQATLGLTGAVHVCVGTLASRATWLAVVVTAVVAFVVLFAGVVSSVIASATVSLLLAFILPVSLRAPASSIPDRLAGFGLAAGASLLAIAFLWPAPAGDRLRGAAISACRGLAGRLRAEASFLLGGPDEREAPAAAATAAIAALHTTFYATPYRPTGLSTSARAVVRLVDEIFWLAAVVDQTRPHPPGTPVDENAIAVKTAVADVLDRGAALLAEPKGPPDRLRDSLDELQAALERVEQSAVAGLRLEDDRGELVADIVSALDPGFRAQELSFAVTQIAANVDLAAAAERRSWLDRMTGRSPKGLPGTLAAAGQRAAAHFEPHSVWLHNSLRGATALSLAVLVASLTGVQHSFWVVLGTLSVLRSNALNTGQTVVRGLAGTAAGVLAGAVLIELIGTNATVLWILLPVAVLIAGFAPAAVSFAAGQAAFSVVLVILFNIIQPVGWHVGLVRIEDVAIGFGVSLAVGVLFWPRGAGRALIQELSEAYAASAGYLAAAVEYGVTRCDHATDPIPEPALEAASAAAAARRLDDAFRTYLAERSAKRVPLAEVTALVNGVIGLRLAADAVLDLWQRGGRGEGDRAAARNELVSIAAAVAGWYEALGSALLGEGVVPEALAPVDDGLVEAVAHDLRDEDGAATELGVRIIWTGDHLDAARRLQWTLAGPAQAVAGRMVARSRAPRLRPARVAVD